MEGEHVLGLERFGGSRHPGHERHGGAEVISKKQVSSTSFLPLSGFGFKDYLPQAGNIFLPQRYSKCFSYV